MKTNSAALCTLPRFSQSLKAMLLDHFMSVYDFNEIHAIMVQALPSRIFRAIKELTPTDIPLFRILLGIRSLPARLMGRGGLPFAGAQPVLEQALSAGFVLLAEEADQELVLGAIGQFWKLRGGSRPNLAQAQEFLAFDQPGYAKVAMNFYVDEGHGDGGVKVSTETRIHAPDPIVRRKFATYWRLIYPGSALIRRMWLKAIKQRSEQG